MSDNLKNRINKRIADIRFFQIGVETNILDSFSDMLTKDEVDKVDKNKTFKVKNNDGILTSENWNDKIDTFFKQRMESYKSSYKDSEKIKLELETIENLTINKTENKVLKNRYKDYLLNKLQQPQQDDNNNDKVKKELHNNIFKGNTYELWFAYKENKQITASSKTDLRVIYELMKSDNYFQSTVELKHYIEWLNINFFDGVIMELKIQYLNTNSNIQRSKDYNHYKNNLKITLK